EFPTLAHHPGPVLTGAPCHLPSAPRCTRLGRTPGCGRGIGGPKARSAQAAQRCPSTTSEEEAMLHLDYIGLLNTDHQRPGPVQMFLEGRESRVRYVLDTLPPWIAERLGQAPARGERHALAGANLALCDQETREALYRALVEGGYKVRPIGAGEAYRE